MYEYLIQAGFASSGVDGKLVWPQGSLLQDFYESSLQEIGKILNGWQITLQGASSTVAEKQEKLEVTKVSEQVSSNRLEHLCYEIGEMQKWQHFMPPFDPSGMHEEDVISVCKLRDDYLNKLFEDFSQCLEEPEQYSFLEIENNIDKIVQIKCDNHGSNVACLVDLYLRIVREEIAKPNKKSHEEVVNMWHALFDSLTILLGKITQILVDMKNIVDHRPRLIVMTGKITVQIYTYLDTLELGLSAFQPGSIQALKKECISSIQEIEKVRQVAVFSPPMHLRCIHLL